MRQKSHLHKCNAIVKIVLVHWCKSQKYYQHEADFLKFGNKTPNIFSCFPNPSASHIEGWAPFIFYLSYLWNSHRTRTTGWFLASDAHAYFCILLHAISYCFEGDLSSYRQKLRLLAYGFLLCEVTTTKSNSWNGWFYFTTWDHSLPPVLCWEFSEAWYIDWLFVFITYDAAQTHVKKLSEKNFTWRSRNLEK